MVEKIIPEIRPALRFGKNLKRFIICFLRFVIKLTNKKWYEYFMQF